MGDFREDAAVGPNHTAEITRKRNGIVKIKTRGETSVLRDRRC